MGSAFHHCRFDHAGSTRVARDVCLPAARTLPDPGRTPTPSTPRANPRHAASVTPTSGQSVKGLVITSWVLLGVAFVISLVPVLGCGSWILAWPVAVATLIMAIVILTRGGKAQGIAILIASVLLVPLTMVVSVASTALLGAAVSEQEKTQEKQIMENLRALSDAKAKWVAQTKVTEGAYTTVAGLTPYLDGKEIKPVVGETYDPKPVGQEPTATLPATKSLASHGKGAVITANGETEPPTATPETL